MSFGKDRPPNTWPNFIEGIKYVEGSDDIYVYVGGPKGEDILVWHWHMPTGKEHRWEAARCTNHTVHSLDPLHLEASLGCYDGCPSHGWIRDGKWQQA